MNFRGTSNLEYELLQKLVFCVMWQVMFSLGRGEAGEGAMGDVQFCMVLEVNRFFLFVMKSSTSSNLLLNFITKLQRILCLLLEYTPSNFWKCNSCTKRENNFYSHYIIPNLKIRVNHMNKSMTFKKYSKCSNTLLC